MCVGRPNVRFWMKAKDTTYRRRCRRRRGENDIIARNNEQVIWTYARSQARAHTRSLIIAVHNAIALDVVVSYKIIVIISCALRIYAQHVTDSPRCDIATHRRYTF